MRERFPTVPDLTCCLCNLIAQAPPGRVTTCGDLAEALGNRIAARWVGHFALHHDHRPECDCHRIVRAGGELGGYAAGSILAKKKRLADEGVAVRQGVIDLGRFGFHDFVTDRPLETLRQVQESIQRRIVLRPRRRIPKLVGGVDVAYPEPEVGVAAYALVETETGKLVWSTTVRRRVVFPYITSYLSFREIPILLELLDAVRAAGRMAKVLLVDGTGILHPRHAGIASHLGVVASLPTIGVTKKLLCGRVEKRGQVQFVQSTLRAVPANCTCPLFSTRVEIEGMAPGESRPVVFEDQLTGVAMRPTSGSRRPIFLSPGHRVDVAFCEQMVRRLLMGRRLPGPIYWADRLSRSGG